MKINALFASLIWVCLLPGVSQAQSASTQPTSADGMAVHHDGDMNMNHMICQLGLEMVTVTVITGHNWL